MCVLIVVVLVGAVLVPNLDIDTNSNDLDVLVIAGQSNAMNSSTITQCNPYIVNSELSPVSGAYYYGTPYAPINPVGYYAMDYDTTLDSYHMEPMVKNGQWIIGGEEPGIASALSHRTSADLYIINVGIAGATIQFLQPGAEGGEYAAKIIQDALDKIPSGYKHVNKLGWAWIQGESNSSTPILDYISMFDKIQGLYDNLGFNTCYMVQTSPSVGVNSSAAQLQICEENPKVILASTAPSTFTQANGLLNADNIHYTQKGRIIVGEDIANAVELPSSSNSMKAILYAIPAVIMIALLLLFIRPRD